MKFRQGLFAILTIAVITAVVHNSREQLFMMSLGPSTSTVVVNNKSPVEGYGSISPSSSTDRCQPLLRALDTFGRPAKRMSPTSPIVFLKTHKTGSTAVQNILLRYGASKKMTFALPPPKSSNHLLCPNVVMPQILAPCWDDGKVDIFAVHTNCLLSDIRNFVKEEAFWFTILRQPDLAFESLYRYCNMRQARMFGVPFGKFVSNPPLRSENRIVTNEILPIGVNQMSRDLGLNVSGMDDAIITADYIEYLDKTFDFFMINEHMDESLILLRHRLGLELLEIIVLEVNKQSRTAKDPLATLSETGRENLRRINSADHLLYDRFHAKFLQELDVFGLQRMAKELQALHCLRESVKEACKFRKLKKEFLPPMYRPTYGPAVDGFFPTANASVMPAELYWLCHRLAYSEVPHLDLARAEQLIQVEDQCSAD